MKKLALFLMISACFLLISVPALAQAKERVRFAHGTHGITVKGTVRGYAYHDYIVGVSSGQTIDVSVSASTPSTVLSIVTPEGGELLEASETESYRGVLITGGDYRVRVLMMRSAARRKGSVSNYTLKISIK